MQIDDSRQHMRMGSDVSSKCIVGNGLCCLLHFTGPPGDLKCTDPGGALCGVSGLAVLCLRHLHRCRLLRMQISRIQHSATALAPHMVRTGRRLVGSRKLMLYLWSVLMLALRP